MSRLVGLPTLVNRAGHPDNVGALMARTVTVLSTGSMASPGEVHLMTVDSFAVVSEAPHTALVALRASSRMVPTIAANGAFAASVLADQQSALATWFASRQRPGGSAQLTGVGWHRAELIDAPLLDDAVGWFECVRPSVATVGDHVVVTAEIVAARSGGPVREPLVRHRRSFRRLTDLKG
jgi:flavin reductase (DIM6/NTAB) family NADH-FMN oxidoreductase RutF